MNDEIKFPCDGCGKVLVLEEMTGTKTVGVFGMVLCDECLAKEI